MIWSKLKHFSPKENWGEPGKMNWALLFVLDCLRSKLPDGCTIKINCAYENDGHATTSFHSREGKGSAVDFVITGLPIHLAFEIAVKYLNEMNIIYGLGAYPYWNTAGFHLDLRADTLYWYRDKKGDYKYYSDSKALLNKLIEVKNG